MNSARVIVEGLRSGIPYRKTAQAVTIGREANIKALVTLLETVESGGRPTMFSQIVRAQYGEGKTHLMHALASSAWDRNWVVSMAAISKETPLDRLDQLYPKLTMNALRPGSTQAGLDSVVTEALAVPHLLAESRAVNLSERTRAILDNLVRQDAGLDELMGDIHGQFLPLATIKRIHRENYGKTLKISSTRIKDEIPSYLGLLDWLISRAGYGGWLILLDEVELIGKFGRGRRARSYANMGRFMEGMGERTVSVWAVAGNFQNDVIVARDDAVHAPQWLASRPQEAKDAELAVMAVDELSAARPLSHPQPAEIREMVERVYDLHQEAYAWSAPLSRNQFYSAVHERIGVVDARIRTWVRLSLSLLDLWFLHGVDAAEVRADELVEIDLSEEPDDHSHKESVELIERRPLFD